MNRAFVALRKPEASRERNMCEDTDVCIKDDCRLSPMHATCAKTPMCNRPRMRASLWARAARAQ
eukprot:6952802-Alexandrium_andersonii.AAC.1